MTKWRDAGDTKRHSRWQIQDSRSGVARRSCRQLVAAEVFVSETNTSAAHSYCGTMKVNRSRLLFEVPKGFSVPAVIRPLARQESSPWGVAAGIGGFRDGEKISVIGSIEGG